MERAETKTTKDSVSFKARLLSALRRFWSTNAAVIVTFAGVVLGLVVGVLLRRWHRFSPFEVMIIGFPGELFVRMVKMLLIPLIVSSIVSSVSQVNAKVIGTLGFKALIYCLGTTALSSTFGIIVAHLLQAGKMREDVVVERPESELEIGIILMDTVRNFVPENLIAACFQKTTTFRKDIPVEANIANETQLFLNSTNATNITNEFQSVYYQRETPGTNTLGLVLFSILLGVVLTQLSQKDPRAKILIDFFSAMNEAVFKLVSMSMWFCPIGIFSLVTEKIVDKGGADQLLYVALLYCIIASSLLMVHAFIILPLLYLIITRKNPYKLIRAALPAITIAFGSESSAITLPTTMRCLHEFGVAPAIYKFVAPIAMTVNMNGGALSYAVVAVFVAQYDNIDLSTSDMIVLVVMAVMTAFMSGATPSGGVGFTVVAIMFQPVNIPVNDFVYVLPLNWLRARFSTSVNILGDIFGAAILDHTSSHLLPETKDEVADRKSSFF